MTRNPSVKTLALSAQDVQALPIHALSENDSQFLAYLRGTAILVIVFGHIGGFWVFRPYSEFLHVFVPIFFFLSGAVSYFSYLRSQTTWEYLQKRLFGLLVPYYLVCVLSLTVYAASHAAAPAFSLEKLFSWLTIRPTRDIMGFRITQVWFLHTLFVISVLSPAYFWLYHNKPWLLWLLLAIPVTLSGVQVVADIDNWFFLAGNNLYKPIVHSLFYIVGFACLSSSVVRNKRLLGALVLWCLALAAGMVVVLNLDVDYADHTFAPDLYYVAGSLAAIGTCLILQQPLLQVCKAVPGLASALSFAHRHTFSIYLLHTFGVYLTEKLFGLVKPQAHLIRYGIVKFALVLAITCCLSIPFSALSTWLTRMCVSLCARFCPRRSLGA
jgi:peptidoglycan/LPS O-acetylase OafA/YrhL